MAPGTRGAALFKPKKITSVAAAGDEGIPDCNIRVAARDENSLGIV
jgi:hypothetical protein